MPRPTTAVRGGSGPRPFSGARAALSAHTPLTKSAEDVLGASGAPGGALTTLQGAMDALEERVFALRAQGASMEEMLLVEAQRRGKRDRDLHEHLTRLVGELEVKFTRSAQDRLAKIHGSMELLAVRVDALSRELAQEREKNDRLTEELRYYVKEGLGEAQRALEVERVMREEREALFRKKLMEDTNNLLAQIVRERDAHRERVEDLKARLEEEERNATQVATEEKSTLEKLQVDLLRVKQRLKVEIDRRVDGERQIASMVESIVGKVRAINECE